MDAVAGACRGYASDTESVPPEGINQGVASRARRHANITMNLSIAELHKLYASGHAKPSDVCRDALDRIERDNQRLNAYVTINRESALKLAAAMDADIQTAVERKPLAGVPVAI